VNVTKNGFFQVSKTFGSGSGTVSNANIQLIAKPASVTVAAASGGAVTVSGGGSVDFTDGFVNATNGTAYTGNVSVSAIYLDPAGQNFNTAVPGNLKSAGASNQPGVLQSFGLTVVELNDDSGNKLQLAPGKTATITLPIPAALQNKAPSTIPLWYFDEIKGRWIEEGKATKQGNNYVGVVKHFSFWNAGDLAGSINVTVSFKDTVGGIPFANKLVTLARLDSTGGGAGATNGHTDNTGTVSGLVPVNEVLEMRVFDDCGAMVYSKNIGPFSQDTALGTITIINSCILDTTQYIHLTLKYPASSNEINYSWVYPRNITQQLDSITTLRGGNTSDPDSAKYISLGMLTGNTTPGNYPFTIYTILEYNKTYNTYYPNNNPNTVVTQYDAVDGYITGSATGWLKNFPLPVTDSVSFTCTYRVKRVQ
jgi:hypothetical protein